MVHQFLFPYFSMLYSAAWNIQQSLDGLGLSSSNIISRDQQGHIVGSYWSPGEALLPIFGLVFLFALLLSLGVVTAGYVLGRKKGALLATAVMLVPGCLGLVSLWPAIPFVPDTYAISGTGVLGSGWGMLPLVGMGMIAGWCAILILIDLTRAGDNFWNAYDHLWYGAGLLAGIFFVADAQVGEHARALQESSREFQQASAFLLKQVAGYDQWCRQNSRTGTASCEWASDVQQKLLDYSTQVPAVQEWLGPKSSAELYRPLGGEANEGSIATIRTEIAEYNRSVCPVTDLGDGFRQLARPSSRCQQTPGSFCTAFPDPLNGKVDKDGARATTALASECVIPTLIRLQAEVEKLSQTATEDRRAKHYRWMYYAFFSLVVGGKIAHATVKLASMNKRSNEETRRALHFVRRVFGLVWRGLKRGLRLMTRPVVGGYGVIRRYALRRAGRQQS